MQHYHDHKQNDKNYHICGTGITNNIHGICNSMNRFKLLNGSIVYTNHSSLQELHLTLCKQLKIHVYSNKHDSEYPQKSTKQQNANVPNHHLHMICDENQFNTGYISCDLFLHRKPPTSPTSVHAINDQTDTFETDTTYPVHEHKIHTIFHIPLQHRSTQKENWLTTRLLYPKTHLPSELPTTMPVFKNRLHRLYAYRRLFKDVNIETVSFEETELFHQQAFSLATIPNTPGYHLNLLTIQDMKRDLHKIWNGVQNSLKEEKALSHEEKMKRDTEFHNHVEAARSQQHMRSNCIPKLILHISQHAQQMMKLSTWTQYGLILNIMSSTC